MKIRRFGSPPPPVEHKPDGKPLGGTGPAATGATGTGAPGATGSSGSSGSADVTLHAGALRFPRVEGLAENAKADRARALLQTLRAPGGEGFGGRVQGNVDVAATLRSYYRALDLAPLASAAGAEAAVARFIEQLDVPDDIRPLLALAAGVASAVPLGAVATYERARDSGQFWDDWRRTSDPDAMRITDATVKAMFGRWGEDTDIHSFLHQGTEQMNVGAFRLFARAKELGLPVTASSIERATQALPANATSAAVLRRFARAFDLDQSTLMLGQRPLSRFDAGGTKTVPLGKVNAYENNSNAWYNAAQAGDVRAFQVTDTTLERLSNDGYTSLDYWLGGAAKGNTVQEALKGFARLAELGNVHLAGIEAGMPLLAASASKDTARALQQIGKACGASVDGLVLGDRTVAEWIGGKRPAPGDAAGGKALGTTRTWENEGSYQKLYDASHQAPRSVRTISDATLRKWFGAWSPNARLADYAGDGTPESRVAFALWWSRAKELGLPAQCDPGHSLTQFAASLPATPDAARALRRLGRAFGFSVEQENIGGKPMGSFTRAPQGSATEERVLPPRAALGDAHLLKAALKTALDKEDPALFQMDDSSIKRLLEQDPDLTAAMTASRDRAWRFGVLDVAARALAIGALTPDLVPGIVGHLPVGLLDDPAISERAATLIVKAGSSADAVMLASGEKLSAHPETAAHIVRLERVLEGSEAELLPRRASPLQVASGPLGNRAGPHSNYWQQRDPGMFEISDAAIRNEMMSWGEMSWLQHWQDAPGVLSLVARIIELNADAGNSYCTARSSATSWLSQTIPEAFGTADALPRLVRLCKAAGVDPKDVIIEHKRSEVPLLKHPEMVKLTAVDKTGGPARAESLAADIGMLAPDATTRGTNGGPARPAEREAAVLHLLGVTDEERPIRHEVAEILDAALQAKRADASSGGGFSRVDLSRVPAKHREAMLATAFGSHDHPVAIALLAGTFFDVDAASVERLLLGKGHLAKTAQEMGALAAQIATLAPDALAFCASGLRLTPPELTSLPMKAWLLGDEATDAAQILARAKADPGNAAALGAAVLERAVLDASLEASDRDAMRAAVQKLEHDGVVVRADLVPLLSAAAKHALDEDAITEMRAAVHELLGAHSEAETSAARAHVAVALAQPTWTGDPNVVATAALEAAAAHDLRFVAALGAVDVKGGGIVGKPWESRLAVAGPRVDIGGVKLPVESAALHAGGRAPRVRVPAYPDDAGSTAAKALQLVATRWLAGQPFCVDDVNAASAVRAIAQATGASVHDVVVTPHTSVDALFGPEGNAHAAAQGKRGVVLLRLDGDTWPAGLADAVQAAARTGTRIVLTGATAIAGLPTLRLPAIDEAGVLSHGRKLGLDDSQAQLLSSAMSELHTRHGVDALPLGVIERVAARLKPIKDDGNYVHLQRAISQVIGAVLPPEQQAALAQTLQRHIGAGDDDGALTVARKVARLGTLPFKIVGETSELPALSAIDHAVFRGAAWALEVHEHVAGDARTVEELGIAYGSLTGRDVHVHLLHAGSEPKDVVSKRVNDVVIVAHGFDAAPEETRAAMLTAAREGQIKLLIESKRGPGEPIDGAYAVTQTVAAIAEAHGVDAITARARAQGQALGLTDVVIDGACTVVQSVADGIANGSFEPLLPGEPSEQLDGLLQLMAQLTKQMPFIEAFVAAVSATYPMTTLAQQEQLEASAREVAT